MWAMADEISEARGGGGCQAGFLVAKELGFLLNYFPYMPIKVSQ